MILGGESTDSGSSSSEDRPSDSDADSKSDVSLISVPRTQESVENPRPKDTDQISSLLGKNPCDPQKFGEDVHEDIANRWAGFLTKGIDREAKKDLLQDYPIINNCKSLQAPKLNSEVSSCLNDTIIRQDMYLGRIQEEIGASISALAIPLNKFYSNPTEENKEHLKALADAAKLLCNAHHSISTHRRHVALPYLNNSARKLTEDFPIDDFLFGDKFADRIKSSKDLQRTSLDIKVQAKPSSSKNYQRPNTKYKNKWKYKGKDQSKQNTWKSRQAPYKKKQVYY